MNTEASIIDDARREQAIRLRRSPFPSMTMELLNAQLNQFRVGELRPAARTWEIMMERDGDLNVPAEKLFSDIARLPWEIARDEESEEADAHAEALKYFYTHLTATSVLEADETGGINLLLRQLMTAHAYRYSIHEIILQISNAGKKEVTAQFNHAPVWFFEARKGRLGFLQKEFDVYGLPLERGEWLPAVGRGMMRQCSVAYLTKWEPLSYWLLFCYRFGVPGIHGKTDAAKDSPEWKDFVAALRAMANDWVSATNRGAEITLIESAKGGTGTLPFPDLIERADRLYARAFRGGDLSTQSRGGGGEIAGANPQEGEKQIILEDGGQWATDILNARVDEPVIQYLFNALPKAWICIRPKKSLDSNREINALKAARDLGVPVSIDTARERLDLPAPEDDEDLIRQGNERQGNEDQNNPALANAAEAALATAVAADLQPLLAAINERLESILQIQDTALRRAKLAALWTEIEPLQRDILADPASARVIERMTAYGFTRGLQGKKPV